MNDDAELLCRYADEGSESAFAELVRRHVDLVYAAAMRRTGGDPHRAADVAQQVFTTLARNARKLSHHALLPAWLHTATRNAAVNLMISEKRRQTRETEALALDGPTAPSGSSPDWDQLRPLLDAAIDELPETDRTAVVLRYLEHRPFADVGAALQVSEDAARMRTDRAMDKLRSALARRGITSSAAALGAVVFAQPLLSAPTNLAPALASQAMAAAGTATLATLMNTKIITTAVVGVLVTFLAGTYVGYTRAAPSPSSSSSATSGLPDPSQTISALRRDKQTLQAEADRLNADVAQLTEANAQLKAQIRPLVKPKNPTIGLAKWETQSMIIGNLKQVEAARKKYKQDHGTEPTSLSDLVGRRNMIRTVRTVGGEDYASVSMEPGSPLTVTTAEGDTVTYDPSGAATTKIEIPPEVAHANELQQKIQPLFDKAIVAYKAAHNGAAPPTPETLLAYFPTPEDAADFAEFLEAKKAANAIGP